MGRLKGQSVMESWMIVNGKSGEQFFSEKPDRHLTALASYHQRKIITEKLIAISCGNEPKTKHIIKVTIL